MLKRAMSPRPARTRRSRPRAVREAGVDVEPLVTISLRLRSGLRTYLEDLAARSRRSVSDVAQQLLEEAIRTRECPGIYFADEPAGRTAKIMGTGLGVWEVMRDYLAAGEREDRLREVFPHLTPAQMSAARNYFLRYRAEVQQKVDENAALTPEMVVARYPGLVRVVE
jgi:uncharacterized protein (DUF433 family)